MRFYTMGKSARIAITILWTAVLALWLDIRFSGMNRRPWTGWIWVALTLLSISNAWASYWTVETDALVQHSLWWHKSFAVENLRYAGPVRRPTLRWWWKRSVELQVAGYSDVRYAAVAERRRFLEALHTVAPQAEVVA